MTTAPCSPWRNPRIVLTLFLVFLAGAGAGMLGMAVGGARLLSEAQAAQPGVRDSGQKAALERIKKELNLTTAQTDQLDMVLDDYFTYYHTLQAQLDDVRASGRQRILRILDENQKRKFEKLMNELQHQNKLR